MKLFLKFMLILLIGVNWSLFVYTVTTGDKSYIYLLFALLPVSVGVIWLEHKVGMKEIDNDSNINQSGLSK